jgi:hypothetical protein
MSGPDTQHLPGAGEFFFSNNYIVTCGQRLTREHKIIRTHHFVGGDLAILREDLPELVLSQVLAEVLDVDIGELLGLLTQLLLALLAGHEPGTNVTN